MTNFFLINGFLYTTVEYPSSSIVSANKARIEYRRKYSWLNDYAQLKNNPK